MLTHLVAAGVIGGVAPVEGEIAGAIPALTGSISATFGDVVETAFERIPQNGFGLGSRRRGRIWTPNAPASSFIQPQKAGEKPAAPRTIVASVEGYIHPLSASAKASVGVSGALGGVIMPLTGEASARSGFLRAVIDEDLLLAA